MTGYSGTPLARKLGLKPGMLLCTLHAPAEYRMWLGELPDGLSIESTLVQPIAAVHVFATERAELERTLTMLRDSLEQGGFIWVSWPKRASKIATDITEDTIREVALPIGFVDIKVCAVSEIWSGLKLVIRKTERTV